MKRLLLLIFIVLASHAIQAQTINMGHSVVLWGQTPETFQIDLEYMDVTVSGIHVYGGPFMDQYGMRIGKNFVGVFYTPDTVVWKNVVLTPMIGILNDPYPNVNGERMMLGIEIQKKIHDGLHLYYKHISNGYRGVTNIGLDSVGLKFDV